MDIEKVWSAFSAIEDQLKEARRGVPVTRTEYVADHIELYKLKEQVSRFYDMTREQYERGIKTGIIAGAAFSAVTFLGCFLCHRFSEK